MEETIKLIIEKGPKEGETLEYKSDKVIKIGRLVRGNTFPIKESGISSNHIAIQFNKLSNHWTLTDLNSSNGTFLNTQAIQPDVPYHLSDGDCVRIGQLTLITVRIFVVEKRRNPRRKGTGAAGGDLGGNVVEGGVGKRNFKKEDVVDMVEVKSTRGRKVRASEDLNLDVNETNKVVVESMSSKRILRSTNKGKKESVVTDMNVLEVPQRTRRFKKKVPMKIDEEEEPVDVVVKGDGRRTRRGRKGVAVVPLETVQSSEPEDNAGTDNKIVRDDEGEEPTYDKSLLDSLVNPPENMENVGTEENMENIGLEENVKNVGLEENVENIGLEENVENDGLEENVENVSSEENDLDHVTEKTILMQEASEGKEAVVGGSLLKESSEFAGLNKGKEVVEDLEDRQHGDDGLVKDTAPDTSRWQDLGKMTLGDFFDYLEYALPKEIYDESEKIISDMEEKSRKCRELRLQRNEKKVTVDMLR